MNDHVSAEQLVGYARVHAANDLVNDHLGFGEPVLLVRLLFLLSQTDPVLAEVGVTFLQQCEDRKELGQVPALGLGEGAQLQAPSGARDLDMGRYRPLAQKAQLTGDEGVVGEIVMPLGAAAHELEVCSEDPDGLPLESSHFADSAEGRSVGRQGLHVLDGDLAGVEVSAHDEDRLRFVDPETPNEVVELLQYFLLQLEVAQVNIEEEGLKGLMGGLQEQNFVKPEGVWEPLGQVTKNNSVGDPDRNSPSAWVRGVYLLPGEVCVIVRRGILDTPSRFLEK